MEAGSTGQLSELVGTGVSLRPAASRGSLLYFVIADLARLDPCAPPAPERRPPTLSRWLRVSSAAGSAADAPRARPLTPPPL